MANGIFFPQRSLLGRKGVALCLMALLFASCESPQSKLPSMSETEILQAQTHQFNLVMSKHLQRARKVAIASHRLRANNQEICPQRHHGSNAGFMVMSLDDVEKGERAYFKKLNLLSKTPRVIALVPGSPAEIAGLRIGDEIIAISDKSTTGHPSAQSFVGRTIARHNPKNTLVITLRRGDEQQTIGYKPGPGCRYPVYLTANNEINAVAVDNEIAIHAGLIDLLGKEEHVAGVIGHEMAHITQQHQAKKTINMVAGTLTGAMVDIAIGTTGVNTGGVFSRLGQKTGGRIYSLGFEKEADYVGLYMTNRAGYDTRQSPEIWNLMATHQPKSIIFARTHPTSAERALLLQKTNAEIEAKKAKVQPLTPDLLSN